MLSLKCRLVKSVATLGLDMDGSMRRLVARGLMVLAALVAVCAFHASSPETVEQPIAAIAGPLHVDLADVPAVDPSADSHEHLTVAWLLGLSLFLLGLVARARRTVAVRPHPPHAAPSFEPPPPPAPSLIQLRISRT